MKMRSTGRRTLSTFGWWTLLALAALGGCKRAAPSVAGLKATAAGTAIVESSGGHQVGATGTLLKDPLVVQVNDDQELLFPAHWWSFMEPRASPLIRLCCLLIPVDRQQPWSLWAPSPEDTRSAQ